MSTSTPGTRSAAPERSLPSPREPAGPERDDGDAKAGQDENAASESSASPGPRQQRAPAVKDVVIVALGGALVVTTPLALLTLRRWWRWWNDLGS